ncbi:hypothetical protein ACFV42_23025 [Streptomyces solisilvae]|uniref:hypothetical protein n=1 Tax=Streptomyces malaysiensis TaxID=92644 RepID=UPI003692A773
MTVRPTKTRTGTTGALIRRALTHAGVNHREGQGAVERGWLATVGYAGPTVYITAHDYKGRWSYDVDRETFIGFSAVVTDGHGTRHVYDGPAMDRSPAVDAEECARAVAAHFGLSPLCGWCEDTGSITLYDDSDGITGVRPCDNPLCVARGERLTAEAERAKAERAERESTHTCTGDSCCPPF